MGARVEFQDGMVPKATRLSGVGTEQMSLCLRWAWAHGSWRAFEGQICHKVWGKISFSQCARADLERKYSVKEELELHWDFEV